MEKVCERYEKIIGHIHIKKLRSIIKSMMSTQKHHPHPDDNGNSYMYVIFTAWNRNNYIGETKDVSIRISQHRANNKKIR